MPGENQKVNPITVHTFVFNMQHPTIPFIPETHFQKVCAYVKYTSSPPQWRKLKLLSSYCSRTSPGSLCHKRAAHWEPSSTHIQHLLVEREQDCCNKTSHLEKRRIEVNGHSSLSSHSSVEQFFLEQLSEGSFIVCFPSLQHQRRTMGWLLCLSWLLQQLVFE